MMLLAKALIKQLVLKALPVGTIRQRSDGKYKKTDNNKWIKINENKVKQENKIESKQKPVKDNIKDIREKWKKSGVELDLYYNLENNRMDLSRISLPKELRGKGIGTKVMQDIIDIADKNKSTITLTPSSDYGGTVSRLKEFYKRFGFVENKGKNKDYSISGKMYREAK